MNDLTQKILTKAVDRALLIERKDIGERIQNIIYSDSLPNTMIFSTLDKYIKQLKEGKNGNNI